MISEYFSLFKQKKMSVYEMLRVHCMILLISNLLTKLKLFISFLNDKLIQLA